MIRSISRLTSRRVVVTGLGAATCFGNNLEYVWQQLLNGNSGVKRINVFDPSELGCKVAAGISLGSGLGEINIEKYIDSREQKRSDRFIQFAYVAAEDAMRDANLVNFLENHSRENVGVIIGSGIGGVPMIEKTVLDAKTFSETRNQDSGEKLNPVRNPFFIPSCLINLASGNISAKFGLKGPNFSIVSACASGSHSIGEAAKMIALGDADIMLAGGAEAAICKVSVAGFDAMKALCAKYNDQPQKASRPWDKDRDGFVMGEGAGVLILEEYSHAIARSAKIYAEVVGYGGSSDAYHPSAPEPNGDGGMRAMRIALENAGISILDIDYINAHGTSTPAGDLVELRAIKRLFEKHPSALKNLTISSTKSSIGHLLGAAGAVEAIFSILALHKGEIPPTINLDNPEEEADGFDLTPYKHGTVRKKAINITLSNSFGFGGTNTSLIFKKL